MHPDVAERYLTALLTAEAGTTSTTPPSRGGPARIPDPTGATANDSEPDSPLGRQGDPGGARSPVTDTRHDQQPDDRLSTSASAAPARTVRPGEAPNVNTGSPPEPDPGTAGVRAVPDLRPPGLALAAEEITFLARLGPLLPTPRAAKKLVNLYRLVRITIPDAELGRFTTEGTYRIVQILLAVLVGAPTQSAAIFTAIRDAGPADDLTSVLCSGSTDPIRVKLSDLLAALRNEHPSWSGTVEAFQPWCPRLARYSFHTRDLTTAGPDAPRLPTSP
jgi:hypothetical protein